MVNCRVVGYSEVIGNLRLLTSHAAHATSRFNSNLKGSSNNSDGCGPPQAEFPLFQSLPQIPQQAFAGTLQRQ